MPAQSADVGAIARVCDLCSFNQHRAYSIRSISGDLRGSMNKHISRREFPFRERRRRPASCLPPASSSSRARRRAIPAGSLGALARRPRRPRRARRHLGHAVAARQATRNARISRCVARTEAACPAVLAAGLLARRLAQVDGACAAPRATWRSGPFEVVAQRGAAKHAGSRVGEGNRRRHRNRHRQVCCRFARNGTNVISAIQRDGREALRDGKLVLLRQDRRRQRRRRAGQAGEFRKRDRESHARAARPGARGGQGRRQTRARRTRSGCRSRCGSISTRAANALRVLHTIVFDGDESKDFIRGVGLRFSVPLSAELLRPARAFRRRERRRVRRSGARPHRPAPRSGQAARATRRSRARPCRPSRRWSQNLLQYIPAFGDWTLSSRTPTRFTIRKRTADGHAWLDSGARQSRQRARLLRRARGRRRVRHPQFLAEPSRAARHPRRAGRRGHGHAVGVGAGCAAHGPALLSRRSRAWTRTRSSTRAASRSPTKTTSPASARRMGVARTSELMLWILPATPARERLAQLARGAAQPAVMVATPQTIVESGVFGHALSLPVADAARHTRRSRSSSTGCSTSTAASRTSAAGTGSGTTATSCTPTTSTATSGATTSAASPGTTRSSPPTCGCGCTSCARAAPTPSVSPRP